MNINIQINDKDKATVTTTSSVASATPDAQDMGASKAGGSNGSVASADVLDIGAPPSWLSDAVKNDASSSSSSSPFEGGQEGAGEGGKAPNF